MRYRSRRDLAEMATSPAFLENHAFKVAAVASTYAFVGDPARLVPAGPRMIATLVAIILALLAVLIF